MPAARSLRCRPAHLSGRQLLRRDPRAAALRRIHRRSDRDAPHGRGAQQVLSECRARVALVFAGRRGLEAHRTRRILRLETSRHAVAAGVRLDRRQTRESAHERSTSSHAGTPADHITPYDRLALDEATLIELLASGTPHQGLVEYFGEALHAELACSWRAPPRASAARAPRRGAASTCCPASWARSSASSAAASGPTTFSGSIPSTSHSAA